MLLWHSAISHGCWLDKVQPGSPSSPLCCASNLYVCLTHFCLFAAYLKPTENLNLVFSRFQAIVSWGWDHWSACRCSFNRLPKNWAQYGMASKKGWILKVFEKTYNDRNFRWSHFDSIYIFSESIALACAGETPASPLSNARHKTVFKLSLSRFDLQWYHSPECVGELANFLKNCPTKGYQIQIASLS